MGCLAWGDTTHSGARGLLGIGTGTVTHRSVWARRPPPPGGPGAGGRPGFVRPPGGLVSRARPAPPGFKRPLPSHLEAEAPRSPIAFLKGEGEAGQPRAHVFTENKSGAGRGCGTLGFEVPASPPPPAGPAPGRGSSATARVGQRNAESGGSLFFFF